MWEAPCGDRSEEGRALGRCFLPISAVCQLTEVTSDSKIEEVERERILLVCLESLAVVREMFLTRGENNVCLVIFTVLLRSSSSVSF